MVAVESRLVELIFSKMSCSKIVYSWWQSAATDGECEQNTFTRHIFLCLSALMIMSHTTLVQGVSARHTIHVSCACVFGFSSTLHFALFTVSPIFHFIFLMYHVIFYVDRFGEKSLVRFREWGVWPFGQQRLLTGYEPKFFDDYHISETTEIFIQQSSGDTKLSYLHDSEISDDTIGRALSLPMFTQKREEPAGRRQACHSLDEGSSSSQSSSVGHVRTARFVQELSSLSWSVRENPCRDSEYEQIRILLERQKEQILRDCRAEIQKHEFQADYDRRSIP